MISKEWYVVSDSQGRGSYVPLSEIGASHLAADGAELHPVDPPIMRDRRPGQYKPAKWREVQVRPNLKGGDDCVVIYPDAEFLYRDITLSSWMRLFGMGELLGFQGRSYCDPESLAFGFVSGPGNAS